MQKVENLHKIICQYGLWSIDVMIEIDLSYQYNNTAVEMGLHREAKEGAGAPRPSGPQAPNVVMNIFSWKFTKTVFL